MANFGDNVKLSGFLDAIRNAENMKEVKKVATSASFQNFRNLYMNDSTPEVGDLINREGVRGNLQSTLNTVSAKDFPPYNQMVTSLGLAGRSFGFKQINDQINALQNIWKMITGQIRTKITEWDLSIYLQQYLYTADDVPTFSLLYHLKEDNLWGYKDERAYAAGILNASLSSAKYLRWNPAADPDLRNWTPPCSEADLTAILTPPPPLRRKFLWWEWAVPSPVTAESLIQEKITSEDAREDTRRLLSLNWGTWYPEYWRLFFNSPQIELTEEEQQKQDEDINAAIDAGTLAENTSEIPKPNSTGINIDSPLFYGRPYSGSPEPTSITGYSSAAVNSLSPKLPLSTSSPEAENYVYFDPLTGIDKVINGWHSSYKYTYTTQEEISIGNGDTRTVEVTRTQENNSLSGYWPNATGNMRAGDASKASLWKVLSGRYLFVGKKVLVLENLTDAAGFAEQLPAGDPVPVLVTSENNNIAFIAPFIKNTRIILTWDRIRVKVAWWYITISLPRFESVTSFQIDLTRLSLFYRQGTEGSFSAATFNIDSYFPMKIRGLYLSIPNRNLGSDDNVVTSKWSTLSPPIPQAKGELIAKAFLTGIWRPKLPFLKAQSAAPIKALVADFYKTFTAAQNTLSSLQTFVTTAAGNTKAFTTIISALPTTVQKKPSISAANIYFSSPNTVTNLKIVLESLSQNNLTSINKALVAIQAGSGVEGYTKNNLLQLSNILPASMDTIRSPQVLLLLTHWMNVLYEQRFDLLCRRLNKQTGTLYNAASVLTNHLLMAADKPTNLVGASLLEEVLKVVYKTTTIPFKKRLERVTTVDERLKTLYVKVEYDSNGNIIRPATGIYILMSGEAKETPDTATPPEYFLTFQEGFAPKIIKNVVASVDPGKLLTLFNNPALTKLEIICACRNLEDWWEINLPEDNRPSVTNYMSDLMLILFKDTEETEGLRLISGGTEVSPIRSQYTDSGFPTEAQSNTQNNFGWGTTGIANRP